MSFRRFFRLPWRTRRQIDADVDDELRFHLESRIAELVALGADEQAARARAEREFGDLEDARQYLTAVDRGTESRTRRDELMREFLHDLGYGLRKLVATPTFTLTVVVTLALGIGASTAIFSVVNQVLLKPFAFPQPDRLMRIQFRQGGGGDASTPLDLTDYRSQSSQFEGYSVIEGVTANFMSPSGEPDRAQGVNVSANFFGLLRTKPLVGRFFTEGEDSRGAPNVAILSEGLWRRAFGADPTVVGRSVRINSQPTTIVGVARAGEQYPLTAEVWLPRRYTEQELTDGSRGARWLGLIGRVKDGASLEQAASEITRISEAMEKRFPEIFKDRRAYAVSLVDYTYNDVSKPLFVLLAATGLVLLIACANVANLMLVRGTAREGEMAIRTALGAGRGRLVRQLVAESLALTALGAAAGVGLARVGVASVLQMAPTSLMLRATTSIDAGALALSAAIAVVTAFVFGVLPALQSRRTDLSHALRAGARGSRGLPSANRVRRAIVVAEVALAVTLLSGAGVLMRSFQRLVSVDPGFVPQQVLRLRVQLPEQAYDDYGKRRQFAGQLMPKLEAIPGAQSVALADWVPLDGGSFGFTFDIRGRAPLPPSQQPGAEVRRVTPSFFETLNIPTVKGRPLTAEDRDGTPPVAVINREFARRHFPNQEPIGQAIQLGWGNDPPNTYRTIVGVIGDVRGNELGAPPDPTVYLSMAQAPAPTVNVLVRSSLSQASLANSVKSVVKELDPMLPVFAVRPLEELVSISAGSQKFMAVLVGIFAAVALTLAAVGLYGVIAYGVSQRTHELGVRVALGATSERVGRMIVREGLVVTAVGLAIGLVASLLARGALTGLLYEVSPTDPATLAAVAAVLALVAALASYLPARRAARVDPVIAMRGD